MMSASNGARASCLPMHALLQHQKQSRPRPLTQVSPVGMCTYQCIATMNTVDMPATAVLHTDAILALFSSTCSDFQSIPCLLQHSKGFRPPALLHSLSQRLSYAHKQHRFCTPTSACRSAVSSRGHSSWPTPGSPAQASAPACPPAATLSLCHPSRRSMELAALPTRATALVSSSTHYNGKSGSKNESPGTA